jgi:single-stranded-DNA-specific exonuclease
MTDEFEVESFLFDTDLIDPFTLPDMDKACERILEAVKNGESITVFGDYDADGVTSTALLYSYLSSRGANVDYYVPDRAGEGYGMNCEAIDRLAERGTRLIVTVDNGISAIEEIEYAKALGIDTVVTDHHKVGEVLPDAVAVVDPHREDSLCEFSEWAGVGVAFKLISALDGNEGYELLEQYADIIALGTVADIVSLKGENRIIVRSGLAFINLAIESNTLRKGISALLAESGSTGSLDASSLAFRVGPRINAAGRMGSAERAIKLLLTDDENEAKALAEEISQANSQRQEIESRITQAAVEIIENEPNIKYRRVIVVSGRDWHQGVIGIVASRLVERYGKPCIVISENDDCAKGSGRSIDGFSLYDALSYCKDTLVQYGGHTLAAGLSVENQRIGEFREKINEYAEALPRPVAELSIDCKLNPASINTEILSSIEMLAPFGAENPQPIFGLYNMEITALQPVGNGKHMRMTLQKNGYSVGAVMFSVTAAEFPFRQSDKVDVAVRLSLGEYMGKERINVQIKDIKFSALDDDKVISSNQVYDDFCAGVLKGACLDVTRELCGEVYRFMRVNNNWRYSAEVLCYRLGLSAERIADCSVALDVLTELGILNCEDMCYTLPAESVKNPIENSCVFNKAQKYRR